MVSTIGGKLFLAIHLYWWYDRRKGDGI